VVIDALDNSAARQMVQRQCRKLRLDCLHIGLHADYAEVIWDENYAVPRDVEGDVCDYPLARNLILLSVAVASEAMIRYVLDGSKTGWSVTLRDFAIREMERPSVQ
jgi:hypothetical protein